MLFEITAEIKKYMLNFKCKTKEIPQNQNKIRILSIIMILKGISHIGIHKFNEFVKHYMGISLLFRHDFRHKWKEK